MNLINGTFSFKNDYNNGAYLGTGEEIGCPHCHSVSSQELFYGLGNEVNNSYLKQVVVHAICNNCNKSSYWLINQDSDEEVLLYPTGETDIQSPEKDMPDDIKVIFKEAAKIAHDSPGSSAALSRLAIKWLTKYLLPNEKGDMNKRISMLADQGLPTMIEQSLNYVGVIGNDTVTPGKIDVYDTEETAVSLLILINMIVEECISRPNKLASMYQSLPNEVREAIEESDE